MGNKERNKIQDVRVKMDRTWLILTPYNDTIHQKGTESYSNKTWPEKDSTENKIKTSTKHKKHGRMIIHTFPVWSGCGDYW